jgi:hypothetical protein
MKENTFVVTGEEQLMPNLILAVARADKIRSMCINLAGVKALPRQFQNLCPLY